MGKLQKFLASKKGKTFFGYAYGWGASIVILGALFKIMHWPGANIMLIVGLGTESLVFFISALEPAAKEYDWSLVYPELAGLDEGNGEKRSVTQELDKMLEEAKIEPALIERLGEGFRSLSDNVGKLSNIGDAAEATTEYSENVKKASHNIGLVNDSYNKALEAVNTIGETSEISKDYFDKMQGITQKLGSLNSMYELELQESDNHIKALNTFQTSLAKTVDNLSNTENSAAQFRDEFEKLASNLTTLNSVYGNMLSAMTGQQRNV